jgi:hypothetical protein
MSLKYSYVSQSYIPRVHLSMHFCSAASVIVKMVTFGMMSDMALICSLLGFSGLWSDAL